MRMVITGGSGFLGSRIADYYNGKYEIFTPTHSDMDITDKEAVTIYLEKIKPDMIIHCAAVSDVGACGREPERTRKINVAGSENIAGAAKNTGAKCILCSSDQVYAKSAVQTPHLEDEVLAPCHEYGRQKLLMEERCMQINPDSVMLRLSWMYDVKRRNEQEHDNFMRKLLHDIQERNDMYFPIYDRRGITNVAEVAKNMERAFGLSGGIYNFGSYNDKNTCETMREVFRRVRGLDASLLHENTSAFADAPRNICMNVDKIKDVGILFSTTEDGLTEVLERRIAKNESGSYL